MLLAEGVYLLPPLSVLFLSRYSQGFQPHSHANFSHAFGLRSKRLLLLLIGMALNLLPLCQQLFVELQFLLSEPFLLRLKPTLLLILLVCTNISVNIENRPSLG